MTEQPTALRLADELEATHYYEDLHEEVAAELRRLHAQRDQLLEALKFYASMMGRRKSDNEPFYMSALDLDCGDRARAAIKNAEEGK